MKAHDFYCSCNVTVNDDQKTIKHLHKSEPKSSPVRMGPALKSQPETERSKKTTSQPASRELLMSLNTVRSEVY